MDTGIILAGGRSRRMGKDKALLPMPGNAETCFVAHLASMLTTLCSEVLLVARDLRQADDYALSVPGVCVLTDGIPDYGPLMGLYSGLRVIHNARALVLAVDMPCVQPTLLAFLLAQPVIDALIVPVVHHVPQVLLAVYPRSLLPMIEECLHAGRRDLLCLLDMAKVEYIDEAQLRQVDPKLRSFVNVNTPGELHGLATFD